MNGYTKNDSIIYHLTDGDIEELLIELELLEKGFSFFYVVDTFDLLDYCFPFGIYSTKADDYSFHEIIDNQIALSEVFHIHKNKPILMDEYYSEIKNKLRSISRLANKDNILINQLDDFYTLSGYDSNNLELLKSSDFEGLLNELKANLSSLLTIAFGIFNQGVNRLKQIVDGRMMLKEFDAGNNEIDSKSITAKFKNTIESPLAKKIMDHYDKAHLKDKKNYLDYIRMKKSLKNDALVIDRVLQINKKLFAEKIIILYLSSNERSRRIFDFPEVKNGSVRLNENIINIRRTRAQLFAKMVLNETNNFQKKKENLEILKRVIKKRVKLLKKDTRYDFERFSPERLFLHSKISRARERHENLKIFTNKFQDYKRFLNELSRVKHLEERDGIVIHILQKFYGQKKIKQVASDYAKSSLYLFELQFNYDYVLYDIISASDPDFRSYFREGRDTVQGVFQQLPIMVCSIKNEFYKTVLEGIVQFILACPYKSDVKEKFLNLQNFTRAFIKKDEESQQIDFEHEIIRTLLICCWGKNLGDEHASDHALDILRMKIPNYKTISKIDVSEFEKDFYMLAIWCLRRSKKFDEANTIATAAIASFGDDPRFFHGRSLNCFSMYMERDLTGVSKSLKSALEDALKAKKLYEEFELDLRPHMITSIINTISYYYCFEGSDIYNLEESRYFIELLKKRIDKIKWMDFPEYFETEAYLEYEEYKSLVAKQASEQKKKDKLSNALREIEKAVQFTTNKNENFVHLRDVIKEEYNKYV
ncbi:hypothetical protein [Ulvibacterium sp.]|uniref:hypothetical protein n=1 Tax=Ulvibacterium sp. TaxID=2665914 RepID=UPI0026172C9E|nr:hypothetical protein [Ulvibacterium sp.]